MDSFERYVRDRQAQEVRNGAMLDLIVFAIVLVVASASFECVHWLCFGRW